MKKELYESIGKNWEQFKLNEADSAFDKAVKKSYDDLLARTKIAMDARIKFLKDAGNKDYLHDQEYLDLQKFWTAMKARIKEKV